MADIIHRIGIKAPISAVYEAVSTVDGVAGWWTKDTTGNAGLGGSMKVRFRSPTGAEVGKMGFDLLTLTADKEVRWRFTSGPEEWIGSDVTFTLSEADGMTVVLFGHRNWREAGEFMAHCSMKWATFLLSLRQFVETEKGRPSPDYLKIDNWN